MTDFIYAVGDIHGHVDHYQAMRRAITKHSDAHYDQGKRKVVWLGDYVDRGPDSKNVIERMINDPMLPRFEQVFLKGNHEDMMIDAIAQGGGDPDGMWSYNGGIETLRSYTTPLDQNLSVHNIPRAHTEWLKSLQTMHRDGPFVFVHAGVDFDDPLTEQLDAVLLWTRSAQFRYNDDKEIPYRVVHGHTPIGKEVEIRQNRINVDTGCFFTGVLSCAVLDANGSKDQVPEIIQIKL